MPPLPHVTIPLLINGPSHHLPHTPDSPVPLSRISPSSTVILFIAFILPSFHISSSSSHDFCDYDRTTFIHFRYSLFVRSPSCPDIYSVLLCVIQFSCTFLILLTPTHLSMMYQVSRPSQMPAPPYKVYTYLP